MAADGRRPLRVLAADDSAVMRGVLRTIFALHASQGDRALPKMELCGLVRDGIEALEAVKTLMPDVLLLDLEMPRMNGLQVLERLRVIAPTLPVIMCSAYTERGARSTLDALSHGAKDYVMKPGQQKDFAAALDSLMEQLLPKIAALAASQEAGWNAGLDVGCKPPAIVATSTGTTQIRTASSVEMAIPVEVVVIAVSTGGPSALELMLPSLPKDFAVPVLIVQHMPRLFTGALAERLNRLCRLPVQQARDGAVVEPGTIWLAPGDAHMEVAAGPGLKPGRAMAKLHQGIPLNSCKPSADYLFRSAAALYGAGTLAVVMTGMGADGLDGAKAVRDAGGAVLAQDEASSAVWGMPGRVARAGLASAIIPLAALAGTLMDRVRSTRTPPLRRVAPEIRREVLYGLL